MIYDTGKFVEEIINNVFYVGWCSRKTTEQSICDLYKLYGFDEPEFVWVMSPMEMKSVAQEHKVGIDGSKLCPLFMIHDTQTSLGQEETARIDYLVNDIYGKFRKIFFDNMNAPIEIFLRDSTLSLSVKWGDLSKVAYTYFLYKNGLMKLDYTEIVIITTLMNILQSCFSFIPLNDVCIICEKQISISLDEDYRLHNKYGMAIKFPDGFGIYAWHGLVVHERYIMDKVTGTKIATEPNQTLRSVLVERYGGVKKVIKDFGFIEAVDEYGTLFSFIGNCAVMVNNSTPEQDGSFKSYMLICPPLMKTPRQAIAWTFGMTGEEYILEMES